MAYRNIYISKNEFEFNKRNDILYEGFVIGIGYAYIAYQSIMEKCAIACEPVSYYYQVIRIQELNISKETIALSFPPLATEEPYDGTSADIRTLKFLLLHPIVATEIGHWLEGSTNITTNTVRFATRKDILTNGDAMQVNAFRHVLWQSCITNKHGIEMAIVVGNTHEENPNTNLSNRRFRRLSNADQTVDLLNNKIGRSIGNTTKMGMKNMALQVLEVFYKDGLYTAYKGNDGSWYIDRTSITKEQYETLKSFYNMLNDFGRTKDEQDKIEKDTKARNEKLLQNFEKKRNSIR